MWEPGARACQACPQRATARRYWQATCNGNKMRKFSQSWQCNRRRRRSFTLSVALPTHRQLRRMASPALLSESASSSRMRIAIPRDSAYYAHPSPMRVGEPIPTGWRASKVQTASNAYEQRSSVERLTAASRQKMVFRPPTEAALRRAAAAAAPETPTYAFNAHSQTGVRPLTAMRVRAEGARLAELLSTVPPAIGGEHITHRQVPAMYTHFTHRSKKQLTVHRNMLLPLDTP